MVKHNHQGNAALFTLDEKSSMPIWLQIKNRFIYLITSGYYLPGDQLPTVRGLAADIEVNYNTISKVYQSLEEDNYVVSKQRQGAFVCDVSNKPGVSIDSTADIITVEYINRCLELGMSIEDIENRFNVCLQKEKAKRAKGQGELYATTREQEEAAGRVVPFPGPQNHIGRATGNGA